MDNQKNNEAIACSCADFVYSVIKGISWLFTTLRACDVIDWPWWLVMMPMFVIFVLAIGGTIMSD